MAEDNTTPNTDNIQGDQLSDLTKLLLGAGSAGVGTYLGAKSNLNVGDMKNTNSIFLSPSAFTKLGGARSMHPAFASKLGYDGPLDHPAAIAKQDDIDNVILNNLGRYKNETDPTQLRYLGGFGWGRGPYTGFGREVPDVGMSISRDLDPGGDQAFTLNHPGGDFHTKFNMEMYPIRGTLDMAGPPTFRSPAWVKKESNGFNSINFDEDLLNNWETKADRLRQTFPQNGAKYPWENSQMPLMAHELQHVVQPRNPDYSNKTHSEAPFEWEARATEHSLIHPDPSYLIPFHYRAQPHNYNYDQYLKHLDLFRTLKDKGVL